MRYIFCFVIGFTSFAANSQSLYLELLGRGYGNSLNYEHNFNKEVQGFNFQIGIGYVPTSLITVPASVNYLTGSGSHHLELGVGGTYIEGFLWADDDKIGPDFGFHGIILYRYQKPDGRFFFKIGATPFVSVDNTSLPWGAIGFGYDLYERE